MACVRIAGIDRECVDNVFSQMELSFHLILDKSVDLSKSEKGIIEKFLSALQINMNLLKK